MITENLSTLKIHKLTQAQYDRELAAGNIDANALYLTPDEEIDLSPYATVEQLDNKADKKHGHNIEDIVYLQLSFDNLQAQIDDKAPAGDYATQSFVTNKIAEAQLSGDGSEIDLTGYATKDDIANIEYPVNSVNGKTGAVSISASDVGAAAASHTHNYAGSSSAGGAATSANKINTNAGSATQPVYFANGIPVKTTYTLGASVPSGAKFTDTVYTHPSYTAKSSGLYKVTVDGTGHVSATTTVAKSDITALGIPAQDTTYSAAGSSLGLVKSGGDVSISGGVITVNDNSHNHTFANISLTSDNYGTSLPSSAPSGAIFFKKVT